MNLEEKRKRIIERLINLNDEELLLLLQKVENLF